MERKKESEFNMVDGVLHGVAISWYENGVKKEECPYEYGLQNGVAREWYRDGTMKIETYYTKGEKIYERKWDDEGKVIAEELF